MNLGRGRRSRRIKEATRNTGDLEYRCAIFQRRRLPFHVSGRSMHQLKLTVVYDSSDERNALVFAEYGEGRRRR